jgi:hypothetical protein
MRPGQATMAARAEASWRELEAAEQAAEVAPEDRISGKMKDPDGTEVTGSDVMVWLPMPSGS